MAMKYKSRRKSQLPSLQENLNIMKTVNFTETFTCKRTAWYFCDNRKYKTLHTVCRWI